MNSLKSRKIYRDQNGIVSILVVSILTITLSLIAIGFSKLADRELRQASDREQSSQAYYAAQSGLNDALAYIASSSPTSFPGCSTPAGASQYFTQDLSGGSNAAKYSCISVDMTPTELFTQVSPGQPVLLKVKASSLKDLYIAWQNTTGGTIWLPGGNQLPREDDPSYAGVTGVLRVGLYEVPNSAASTCNTNNCLSGHSSVYYLYPKAGGGNPNHVNYNSGDYSVASGPSHQNGNFIDGKCRTPAPTFVPTPDSRPQYCNSEIKGLDGANNTYYLYLTAQYAELNVSVQGTFTPGNQPAKFAESEATVDVTGRASGVIQRIKAHVNLGSSFGLPNYAVQSMETLCKNFWVDVTGGNATGPTQYGGATVKENPDNACFAPSGGGNIVGGGTAGH